MTNYLRMVLAVACLCIGVSARAETVAGAKVNCRAEARTTSRVLGTLDRGDEVKVLATTGGWSRVDPPRLPACWVRSDLLNRGASASYGFSSHRPSHTIQARGTSHQRGRVHTATRHAAASRHRSTSGGRHGVYGGSYGGGGCPCSGSKICVGPRGGRYCITSGGNKRYGV